MGWWSRFSGKPGEGRAEKLAKQYADAQEDWELVTCSVCASEEDRVVVRVVFQHRHHPTRPPRRAAVAIAHGSDEVVRLGEEEARQYLPGPWR